MVMFRLLPPQQVRATMHLVICTRMATRWRWSQLRQSQTKREKDAAAEIVMDAEMERACSELELNSSAREAVQNIHESRFLSELALDTYLFRLLKKNHRSLASMQRFAHASPFCARWHLRHILFRSTPLLKIA